MTQIGSWMKRRRVPTAAAVRADPRSLPWMALAILVVALTIIFPDPAFAQSSGGIENIAQAVLDIVTGPVAKVLAVIAVAVVGFLFFTGRGNVGALVTVIIGIAIVFSADWIVNTIVG